ncbi:MAG: phospholipase [Halomonadaceae bacterium]|nr:MAG: phospholipase [Halomonadaceae bacterium]
MALFLTLLALLLLATGLYHRYKPLPPGVGETWPWRPAQQVRFLADTHYQTPQGQPHTERQLMPALLALIHEARGEILLDNFLFNPDQADPAQHQPLANTLTDALIAKRQQQPPVTITLITDPINTLYSAHQPRHLARLQQAGVQLHITELRALRDGNPCWSAPWRLTASAFTPLTTTSPGGGWLPSPLGPHPVTLRALLALPNFKANHRKTLVVDGQQGLVCSMNIHDASSCHSNVGLAFRGPVAQDLARSEAAVLAFTRRGLRRKPRPSSLPHGQPPVTSLPRLRLLTEGAITEALLKIIHRARQGDQLRLALFYLSHRPLIQVLKGAHQRGVKIQLLLDPNRDAFGYQKNGIPNRPVAGELHRAGIHVRWYATRGEQFHSKLLLLDGHSHSDLLLGSANFTRRNLDNLNLESALQWQASPEETAITDARHWFHRLWHNQGADFTLDYPAYKDERRLRYWQYRFMEASGFSTF